MTSESQVAAIFFTFLVATFIINNKTHKKQLGMQVTHAAEPIRGTRVRVRVCIYIAVGKGDGSTKKASDIQRAKDAFASRL